MDGELKIYINGIKVSYSPETLQVLKDEYDIEPKYSFGKREFTATFEVEGSYLAYKLMFGNDLKASKVRFKDIREHYYANQNKLMELWQNDRKYRKQRL